jgi:predicted transcriptional regulator
MTFDEICRRAGGRRRYNAARRKAADKCRSDVARMLCQYGRHKRGVQARIARELGVSEATVSRAAADPRTLVYLFLYGERMADYRAVMMLMYGG